MISFRLGFRRGVGFFGGYLQELPCCSDFERYPIEMNMVCNLINFMKDESVFQHTAERHSTKKIADMLCVSIITIKSRRTKIMGKLGAESPLRPAHIATQLALVDQDLQISIRRHPINKVSSQDSQTQPVLSLFRGTEIIIFRMIHCGFFYRHMSLG